MSLAREDVAYVQELVRQEAGIVIDASKDYLVESRLRPVAQAHRLRSVGELIAGLRSQPPDGLHGEVVAAMTTNETSFFRDNHPFAALERHVLPELIARRSDQRQLRIWCAACSSGQEPYSVALLIAERFPQLRTGWHLDLLATDVNEAMLQRAREGRYSELETRRGLPGWLRSRWFHREGGDWRLAREIRDMVRFQTHNLVRPWPPLPAFDLVLLRNVLIYFDHRAKCEILRRTRGVMARDAVLLLGSSETTLHVDDAFHRRQIDQTTVYQLTSGG